MVQSLYNCRMSELYTILRLGWNACDANLTAFTGFSAAYTSGFVVVRLAEIDAAELLPDFQARNSIAQNLRTDLIAVNDRVLLYFKQLQRYITYAYPVAQHVAQYDAAGYAYYSEAANLNWDSSAAMLVSMTNFIAANSVQLQATNNMPTTFEALVIAVKTLFDSTHADFLTAENAAFVATETKVEANNLCYQNLIAMFSDAKYLGFSPALMKSFTFASLLSLVSSGAPSKLRGTVTDALTGLGIANASVELTNLGVSVVGNADGEYLFNSVPYGTYNILAQATGYADYTGVVVVQPSVSATYTTFDIQMSV